MGFRPTVSRAYGQTVTSSEQPINKPDETTPLTAGCADFADRIGEKWKPGPGFIWIEIGMSKQPL